MVQELKKTDYEKLKQIFNSTETDEQKRIKIAFAEGYESGLHRQTRGQLLLLKIMQRMIVVSMIITAIIVIWLYRMYENVQRNPSCRKSLR